MEEKATARNAGNIRTEAACTVTLSPRSTATALDLSHCGTSSFSETSLSEIPNELTWSSSSQLSNLEHSDIDDGAPSTDMHRDIIRTLKLIVEERHLVADDLYQDVRARMDSYKSKVDGGSDEEVTSVQSMGEEAVQNYAAASQAVEQDKEKFQKLEHRALLFRRAKRNLTLDDDWTLSYETDSGLKIYHRREADNSLSIKVEGELSDSPVLEQVAVTREIDLYHHWAPFCIASEKLAQLGPLDAIGWLKIGAVGLVRDACYRAIGCDSLTEDGCIFITARSLSGVKSNALNNDSQLNESNTPLHSPSSDKDEEQDDSYINSYFENDPSLKTIMLPLEPTGFGAARMNLRKFECMVEVTSPHNARTCIVANLDLNIPLLPQSLINFCMKKMCGTMLHKLQSAALKTANDPLKSIHARRIREDSKFYKEWLMLRAEQYCIAMGWKIPSIEALAIEVDLERDPSKPNYNLSLLSRNDSEQIPYSDTSVGEVSSVQSAPKAISSLRAPLLHENLLRPREKHFSTQQVMRIREIKSNMVPEPLRPTPDHPNSTERNSSLSNLDILVSLSNNILKTCDGIPQQYIIPALVLISAVVFPANFDKYLACPNPESYKAFFMSNVTSIIVGVLTLVILIGVHFTVITVALLSSINDIEFINGAFAHTRHLLITKIQYTTVYLSGGIAALAIFRAVITLISRILYRWLLKLSTMFDSLWGPIKMIGAADRTVVAIIAEKIEKMICLPFTILSFLFSPVLYRLGFISRTLHGDAHLTPSTNYYFWKEVIHSTQLVMLYTVIFLLFSIWIGKKVYASMGEGNVEEGNNDKGETPVDSHSLFKIEEDSVSMEGSVSSLKEESERSLSAQDISVSDEMSALTTKSKGKRKKKIKNAFKFMKKKRSKDIIPPQDETASVPSPVCVNGSIKRE